MSFPSISAQCEKQTASFQIWTRVTVSTSNDDKCYVTSGFSTRYTLLRSRFRWMVNVKLVLLAFHSRRTNCHKFTIHKTTSPRLPQLVLLFSCRHFVFCCHLFDLVSYYPNVLKRKFLIKLSSPRPLLCYFFFVLL